MGNWYVLVPLKYYELLELVEGMSYGISLLRYRLKKI